jgi:hypothetical protein
MKRSNKRMTSQVFDEVEGYIVLFPLQELSPFLDVIYYLLLSVFVRRRPLTFEHF